MDNIVNNIIDYGYKFLAWCKRLPRGLVVFLCSLLIVLIICGSVWAYGYGHYLAPVNSRATEMIEVEIKSGSSSSTIANLLEEQNIIRSSAVFKLYVDFLDKRSKLKAGIYELSQNMTVEEVVDKLCEGDGASESAVSIRFPEGGTIRDYYRILTEKGFIIDEASFMLSMKTGDLYMDNVFIKDASTPKEIRTDEGELSGPFANTKPIEGTSDFLMEGYLFPDTYLFYQNSGEGQIVNKLLSQFGNKFTPALAERAAELGFTTHEVIILASLIEKEAGSGAGVFEKVSAVFHNRLLANMALGSCASINYVQGVRKLYLSDEDTAKESPYNTYKYKGLPVGPICNPSEKAILAALYPDEDFMKEKYLYFCSGDPEKNELVFAKSGSEHEKNKEKYKDLWIAWDKKHSGQ